MKFLTSAFLFISVYGLAGCSQDLRDQPRFEAYEESRFFADGRSSRSPLPGTVPRGHLELDEHLYTGRYQGRLVQDFPFSITQEVLKKGQEKFNIHCSVCHDRAGRGQGLIVRRGFSPPPSYHSDRLRNAPVGHFFNVITNGLGKMPRYGPYLSAQERWAVIAYIRALQLSQNADRKVLNRYPDAKKELEKLKQ